MIAIVRNDKADERIVKEGRNNYNNLASLSF